MAGDAATTFNCITRPSASKPVVVPSIKTAVNVQPFSSVVSITFEQGL
jgi:hypothetical protein